MVEVIFAVNDPMKGPNVVLFESTGEKDQNLALKVPVKAQLTLSLMDKDATVKVADAVLPFPDLQKTAFSFLFTINSNNKQITGSISYLVPQADNMNLYKKIPELKEKMQFIVNQLQNWNYKSDTPLPKNLYDMITGILVTETDTSYKALDLASQVTTDKSTGAPDYLIKKVNKNLEHLFFELYVGRPVIVLGKSRIAVEYAMATLDFLTPQKNLRKVIFSEEFLDPANYLNKIDVYGVSSVHEKKYKDYLVVDVDKFEIKGTRGKKVYFKRFMDDLIRIPASLAVQDILDFINKTDTLVSRLEDIYKQPDFSEDKLKQFLKSLNYDEANALSDIASANQPGLSKGLTQQFTGKLSSWIDELR